MADSHVTLRKCLHISTYNCYESDNEYQFMMSALVHPLDQHQFVQCGLARQGELVRSVYKDAYIVHPSLRPKLPSPPSDAVLAEQVASQRGEDQWTTTVSS